MLTVGRHIASKLKFLDNFTYTLFTSRSRVLLEKLTGFQLVKEFPEFYGT